MESIRDQIFSVMSWAKVNGKSITDAWAVSDSIGHDPVRGHYFEDRGTGKSYFYDKVGPVIPKQDPLTSNDFVQIFAFYTVGGIHLGYECDSKCTKPEEEVVTVVQCHGTLQLQSKNPSNWEIAEEVVSDLHVVLTNEGDIGWAVASVCPGLPAKMTFADWSNGKYKEGDSINVRELPEDLVRRVIIK